MRITILLAVLALTTSFYLSSCDLSLAQNIDNTDELITSTTDPGAVEIGDSLILPSSPLYFLKTFRERIELVMSSSREAKVHRNLEFAQRRLRDIKGLVKTKKQDLIPSTAEKYNYFVEQALGIADKDENLRIKITEALSRHLDVLQRVYDQVGNPRAKQAIRAALIRSHEHNGRVITNLDTVPQQQLIKKIASRQAFACKLLLREASASGLNDTERAFIQEKVTECKKEVREHLKDELQDLKRQATPSAK